MMSDAELDRLTEVLEAQWERLRAWVGELDEDAQQHPSVLAGWSVEELVAHLGRAMVTLATLETAPEGTVPLTLGEYVSHYPERAADIAETTRRVAAEIRGDRLGSVDRMVRDAFDRLAEVRRTATEPDPVVQARRGPMLLSEMVVSRLLELTVHADDLARSTSRPGPSPVLPDAARVVADALLEVVVDRGGWDLEIVDDVAWIRLACGRVPYSSPALAGALRARHTSEGVPDLERMMPLL